LLPPELLQRIADGDQRLGGLTPADYHLPEGAKLRAVIEQAWGNLLGRWTAFQALPALSAGQSGTNQTREKWLYPLFEQLGYGWLKQMVAREPVILGEGEADHYPISHRWGQHTPLHLIGVNVELDRRTPGVREHREDQRSPHSLVQELLNRTGDRHLWAVVSNGQQLRLLRNNASFTRQAFVEFDLEAMFNGQVFADFALLWLLVHSSRLEGERPADCWLERWHKGAEQAGVVALDRLRDGVRAAVEILGRGFLAHPVNDTLRDALQEGWLPKEDFYRHVLRLVYRLLFLFVAEDRDLLAPPGADPKAVECYRRYYSTVRLRDLAGKRCGSDHHDLYHSLALVMTRLDQTGCPELALPALGSLLWSAEALTVRNGERHVSLMECRLSNKALLEAVYELAYIVDGKVRRPVDYKNLGSEELGSVYESLLEQDPRVDLTAPPERLFELHEVAGSERKQAGAYYTPTSLIQCLLDSALDPVLGEACRQPDPAAALLALKVCDPACGSGHFLIAAAWGIARRLASIRSGETEATPEAVRSALREVIGRCIYGVDINPMAAELCKVALWIEALDPGKPLSFLDHHIRVGNSLLGTTPALLKDGVPDAAFEPIEGDDKALCRAYKKQNKEERQGYVSLFEDAAPWEQLGNLTAAMQQLNLLSDDTVADVRRKEEMFRRYDDESSYRTSGRFLADLWCAAFVWKKTRDFDYPITERIFRRVWKNPHDVQPWMYQEVRRLAGEYQFFHWHLAYPDVFRVPLREATLENEQTGWNGGFDVVLGNPPWERIKLQEHEWFASRRPDIATARNTAERRRKIAALEAEDPRLYRAFLDSRRRAEGESHFVRNSSGMQADGHRRWGRFPLCARGDINTYMLFAETNRLLITPHGRVGCIVPSGIATDDTTKVFFQDLMRTRTLESLYDFENREGIFPSIDSRFKFCLLTMTGAARPIEHEAAFAFFLHRVDQLNDPKRRFFLTAEDIALLNPTTLTCPVLLSRRDADALKRIHRMIPTLGKQMNDGDWKLDIFQKMIDVTIHANLLSFTASPPEPDWCAVYEGRSIRLYNHRATTYEGVSEEERTSGKPRELTAEELDNPYVQFYPSCWVRKSTFKERLGFREIRHEWFPSVRYVTNTTNERTVIAGIRPYVPSNNKLSTLFLDASSPDQACFIANFSSFVFDYVARQKVGGTTLGGYIVEQLPALPTDKYASTCPWSPHELLQEWFLPRVLELTYTAWDLHDFASDCGYSGPPFHWNEDRRFLLRCELDAAFFHLYGIGRDDADYIMGTFPIVKRKDEDQHGEYRTKRVILEIYDALAEAGRTARPYQTRLDPPPADPRVAHPDRPSVTEAVWPEHQE
jgi:hypothetical protein